MQRSDVDRIAEMRGSLLEILTSVLECELAVHALGDTEWCETHDIEVDSHYCAHVQYVAERLIKSGIGHVPTALHQAADALDYAADVASYETGPGLDEAEKIVRARADRAGREAHAS